MTEATIGRPMIGRRELILGAGAALAAAAVGPGRGALDMLPGVGDGAAGFERTDISARVGETFRIIEGPARGTALTIADVSELPTGSVVPELQFAVRFGAAAGNTLAADTYTFDTRSFGRLPLFVTPLTGADGVVRGYEALVDRYIPGEEGARP